MRVIEQKMIRAIRNHRDMHDSNTSVVWNESRCDVFLHGIRIAVITDESIVITNCGGWRSNTTKSRLNAILTEFTKDYFIYQKDYIWYVGVGSRNSADNEEFKPMELKRCY